MNISLKKPLLNMVLLSLVTLSAYTYAGEAQSYLQVDGRWLVDNNGHKVVLRGFGLGGWMLPEGYMLEFPNPYSSPTKIREAVVDLTGEKAATKFFELYESNYVTQQDLAKVKSWGFNSIRIAFNANRILPPAKQKDPEQLVFDESGMALLDKAVRWSAQQELYVILDMHGAPGGQSSHNIADAVDGALLWEKPEIYQPRTIALWQALAKRYNENPWVIGYDLINEPILPGTEELGWEKLEQHNNQPLRDLYGRLTQAIREIDQGKKILFIEGGFWAQQFKDLTPPWDDNMVYTFHAYPAPSKVEQLPKYVKELHAAGYPIWFGEGGENYSKLKWQEWLEHNRAFTSMLEKETVGWSWWTTKKFSRTTQPWQCFLPEKFSLIRNYLAGHGPKPSQAEAQKILFAYVKNLQTKRCEFIPEMLQSIGGKLK
ncbi:Endoglucanase C307 [Thalassocella blandensis]|nr:Endoglucanase C307 [Thalassocella blandensis]